MEGAKFNNKGAQGNNRRFFRNRREDNSFNQQENNISSQGGKVNSVKPRYSSVKHTKYPDTKPGTVVINPNVGNRNENKDHNLKGKDGLFHGQHTHKEHRSNVKQDDRRKFNFPKEKGNRHFKPTGRNQNSRGNETPGSLPSNDETKSRKQPCKNENGSVVLKRNDNINASMTSTPQHLKPAVHVQPLQQEKTGPDVRSTVEPNPSSLQAAASSQRTSSQGSPGAEVCQEVSNVGHAKETNTYTSYQTHSEQDSSTMVPGEVEVSLDRKDSKPDFQKSVLDQNPLNQIKPIFQSSLADLNTSTGGLGSYLSSSICSSFVPALQKDSLNSQSNPPTSQSMVQDGCLSPAQLALAQSSNHSKKFHTATEQNLVPLINRSQDLHPRAVPYVTEPFLDNSQNADIFHVPRDQLEQAVSLQSMPDEKYGYRISVDSLFSTSFFTNPQASVMNKKEIVEIDARDPLDMAKNKKCNETVVFSGQVSRDQLLNEAQQYDVTSLLAYPPSHSGENYKKDETFDPRLVSPRRSKGVDKPTLGSPPPVLRSIAPHVCLGSPTALMKDVPFSLENTNVRTYRNFSDQTEENIGKEILPTGKMPDFTRDGNSKPDMASEKEVLNNVHVPQLSRTQVLQEPMTKLSLTNNISDVQPDSLVNLNYREIPKQSIGLPTDGFASEAKESVSVRGPITTDKTSLLTKAKLQPASSDKEVYGKQNDSALLSTDVEDSHVHRGPYPQGPPFLANPFLGHSLLTHRQAIPSAFVYPSRVGMPGNHSGFTDVAQHTGTNPGTHIFPPPGTTVGLNVGGRVFEILTSTFSPYSESLLYQIFTGATPAPISQRGHIFFDRDGYLFEIILAFARVGHLTLPPNVNLSSLMNEAKFFGMYEYMFQKGQVSSGNMLQFQRTTRCTLHCDDSSKISETRVFVLQGDDKLKIESLRVSGPCYLYVDIYTPLGILTFKIPSSRQTSNEEAIFSSFLLRVKETSNFVIYTPDKPDLWKAYQFCAERQLVFHLEPAHSDTTVKSCNESSVDIVFSQTFVFVGDEFVP